MSILSIHRTRMVCPSSYFNRGNGGASYASPELVHRIDLSTYGAVPEKSILEVECYGRAFPAAAIESSIERTGTLTASS